MIITRIWDPVSKTTRRVEPRELEKSQEALVGPRDVMWIDLSAPTPEEEDLVLRRFVPVHPLTLEDINRPRRALDTAPHLPKVEEFADYLLVIVNPVTTEYLHRVKSDGHLNNLPTRFTQLSGVITANILITHHYEPLECVEEVQKFLDRHETRCERGPDYLFHLLLDNTVDEYVPVLDFIDNTLDEVELEVLHKPQPEILRRLIHLKREIIQLRKTFVLEREVLVPLTRGEFALVSAEETAYYRNVYDHLVRFTDLMESSRDMVADLMQSYLASISNRLNEVMKVLTMISTVVLPMTLVAGIYGMNFKHMPEIDQPWGYPFALVVMVAMGIGSFAFFRWKKWV